MSVCPSGKKDIEGEVAFTSMMYHENDDVY